MTKTGAEHIARLRDGREVYLQGEKVGDVTVHPAYRNVVRSTAELFEFATNPTNRELMTFESPDTGEPVNRIWQLPTCYDELIQRRHALEAWARLHVGFMGRAPDHVASCMAGMYMGLEVFQAY